MKTDANVLATVAHLPGQQMCHTDGCADALLNACVIVFVLYVSQSVRAQLKDEGGRMKDEVDA